MKDKYESFQKEKFEERYQSIDTEIHEVKELVQETDQ